MLVCYVAFSFGGANLSSGPCVTLVSVVTSVSSSQNPPTHPWLLFYCFVCPHVVWSWCVCVCVVIDVLDVMYGLKSCTVSLFVPLCISRIHRLLFKAHAHEDRRPRSLVQQLKLSGSASHLKLCHMRTLTRCFGSYDDGSLLSDILGYLDSQKTPVTKL